MGNHYPTLQIVTCQLITYLISFILGFNSPGNPYSYKEAFKCNTNPSSSYSLAICILWWSTETWTVHLTSYTVRLKLLAMTWPLMKNVYSAAVESSVPSWPGSWNGSVRAVVSCKNLSFAQDTINVEVQHCMCNADSTGMSRHNG